VFKRIFYDDSDSILSEEKIKKFIEVVIERGDIKREEVLFQKY